MVLVVDDDKGIVRTLSRLLQRAGYRVQTASNGVEAYRHLKSPECKCMLLDIRMPQVNGVELLILMQSEGIHVPTIVMAGFGDFDEPEMKQFSNVVKFFKKPFKMGDMLKEVKTCTAD